MEQVLHVTMERYLSIVWILFVNYTQCLCILHVYYYFTAMGNGIVLTHKFQIQCNLILLIMCIVNFFKLCIVKNTNTITIISPKLIMNSNEFFV